MSLFLNELKIHNFRNHGSFHIEEPGRLIIIIGRNATGKTNIVEAVQLVSMLESFRTPQWSTVVGNNDLNTSVEAEFTQNGRALTIRMDIEDGRRSYSLNDKKHNKVDLIGLIPAVIFVPDDLNLIKESAETRRKLVDDIGKQLSSTYLQIGADYQKTIRQRNMILREYKEEKGLTPLLDSWDENLVVLGALLFTHRIRLYRRYMERARFFYRQLTGEEELSSRYIPSFLQPGEELTDEDLVEMDKEEVERRLTDALKEAREKELAREKSLVGPHRDEIIFYLDGYEARKYASQGQQRSIALALKLGQLDLIREISGNQPLLLLDDVMSELDGSRREALIKTIDGQVQTIITATDLQCFNGPLWESAQIIELV